MSALLLVLVVLTPSFAVPLEAARGQMSRTPAAPIVASEPAAVVPAAAVSAALVLKVAQKEPTADALVARARELGGWFAERTEERVVLRVPTASIEALVSYAGTLGVVADRSWQRADHGAELADLRARLGAREEMLGRYEALLAEADADAVLTVERELVRLIAAIEELRGDIRLREHEAAYARLSVSFRFQDRRAPASDGSSSFAWINSVNLTDLLGDMRWGFRRGSGPKGALPDGFAAYRSRGAWRAASPEAVVYRERRVRQKPEADLSFWKEALRNRLVAAGYRLDGEGTASRDGVDGAWLELSAPVGTVDYRYFVAIFPEGRRLWIVEAAGDIVPYTRRREAILRAVSGQDAVSGEGPR